MHRYIHGVITHNPTHATRTSRISWNTVIPYPLYLTYLTQPNRHPSHHPSMHGHCPHNSTGTYPIITTCMIISCNIYQIPHTSRSAWASWMNLQTIRIIKMHISSRPRVSSGTNNHTSMGNNWLKDYTPNRPTPTQARTTRIPAISSGRGLNSIRKTIRIFKTIASVENPETATTFPIQERIHRTFIIYHTTWQPVNI